MNRDRDSREPKSIGDALERLAGDLRLGNLAGSARLTEVWPRVAGTEMAAHARPGRLRDGVLTVEVDAPAWASQIRYLGADLARRLNEAVASQVVREVRVVVKHR